jgi:hypothetical protein
MRGEIDGLLVKIAGLNWVNVTSAEMSVKMAVLSMYLIIWT